MSLASWSIGLTYATRAGTTHPRNEDKHLRQEIFLSNRIRIHFRDNKIICRILCTLLHHSSENIILIS